MLRPAGSEELLSQFWQIGIAMGIRHCLHSLDALGKESRRRVCRCAGLEHDQLNAHASLRLPPPSPKDRSLGPEGATQACCRLLGTRSRDLTGCGWKKKGDQADACASAHTQRFQINLLAQSGQWHSSQNPPSSPPARSIPKPPVRDFPPFLQ
jgi:hypothetical protein